MGAERRLRLSGKTAAFAFVGLLVVALAEPRPRGVAQEPTRQPTAQDAGPSRDVPGLDVRGARLVEFMDVWLAAAYSGVAEDPANNKLVELSVGFPHGRYSTKNLALEYRLLGKVHRKECGGYASPRGPWFYVSSDKGVSKALDFPGGDGGTIRAMRLLFAVPKE